MKWCTNSKSHRQNIMALLRAEIEFLSKFFPQITKHEHTSQKPDCSVFPPSMSPFAMCLLCFLLINTLLASGTYMLTICSCLSLCLSTVRECIHAHTESIPNCCIIEISFMLQKIIFTKSFPFALVLWILKHWRSSFSDCKQKLSKEGTKGFINCKESKMHQAQELKTWVHTNSEVPLW